MIKDQQRANELEYKMMRLKAAFPQTDPMELQDILRGNNLNLEAALKAAADAVGSSAVGSSAVGSGDVGSSAQGLARSPSSKHVKVRVCGERLVNWSISNCPLHPLLFISIFVIGFCIYRYSVFV